MKSGYTEAIRLAYEKLNKLDHEKVCARTGAVYSKGLPRGAANRGGPQNGVYYIPWFGEKKSLDDGSQMEQVLWLHYLISEGTKLPVGKYLAYREAPGAVFYENKFIARAVTPLVKCFGKEPPALVKAGLKLGGDPAGTGDASIRLHVLPNVPVTYIIWSGDDEMGPEGNILFDETALGWLPTEDLAVLASLGAYKLIGVHNEPS